MRSSESYVHRRIGERDHFMRRIYWFSNTELADIHYIYGVAGGGGMQKSQYALRAPPKQNHEAPTRFNSDMWGYLDRTYPHRWIGRCGSAAWPPRSSDLIPKNFFLCR
ncbi:hypothetical protein AVEN_11670-1 [Araneus ventricosus]|uniref:Uncharacterized protein n=1 Tax=Araneus ventricosus TaxID=182803 RepID=A0A4Y1ZKB1_ARAVE|nr:hypothetical protein AVEN_170878-1 [Araneus ventricosus]GBM97655.1 hypothetical protein AVEN_11670-1 [Araneus ventricosus]